MKCLKHVSYINDENIIATCNNCLDGTCVLRCKLEDGLENEKNDKNQKNEKVEKDAKDVADKKGAVISFTSAFENLDTNIGNTIHAYVDGSFNQNTGTYGYGAYICMDNLTETLSGQGSDKDVASMRNVAGELLGAMNVIKYANAKGYKKLKLYYDYKGIEAWATNKWKANNKYTKGYKNYVQNLMKQGLVIEFEHIKAHTGNVGNELADKLAKKAVGL